MVMNTWEVKIVQALRDAATGFFDILFEAITFLGEKEVLIVLLILVYFIYSKKAGQRLAYAVFTSLLLNNTVKGLVKRPRPWTVADYQPARLETATGYSFPSGHSQISATTYASFALVFKRRTITIAVSALITLIGFSRIYLGVHYPSDVLAGIFLGVGIAVVGTYLHGKCEDCIKKQMLLYLLTLVIFLPFVFIFWRRDYESIEIYRDFYTSYAFFAGYIAASAIERRFVNFTDRAPMKIKIIRTVIAIVLVIGVLFGLKTVLPEKNIFMDMLRYALLPVIGLGLYPLACKNVLFFSENQSNNA
jgi:membrane-associated phospholipid phosphatase